MRSFPATAAPEMTPAEALRAAFDLFEVGVGLMRRTLRRENPLVSDTEVEAMLETWLHERPGARDGDASGRPCRRASLGG